ncbi:STAS domain-containing protein [Peptoniphilus sp.]|uniref:STAS domain-containing protein n=1 Tax=Peptoniphilus sp. TaxID=1971214 RepID=UPI003994E310
MAFEIHSKVEDNLKIFPVGELDIYQSENFKNEVLSLYEENPKDIVFDFEKLEYIDSTGLGALIFIYKNVFENNKVKIENVNPNIRKLFTITKLDTMFIIGD